MTLSKSCFSLSFLSALPGGGYRLQPLADLAPPLTHCVTLDKLPATNTHAVVLPPSRGSGGMQFQSLDHTFCPSHPISISLAHSFIPSPNQYLLIIYMSDIEDFLSSSEASEQDKLVK